MFGLSTAKLVIVGGLMLAAFAGGIALEYKISLSSYAGLEAKVAKTEADALIAAAKEQARQADIAAAAAKADAAKQQTLASQAEARMREYRANAKAKLRCRISDDFIRLFNGAVGSTAADPDKRP